MNGTTVTIVKSAKAYEVEGVKFYSPSTTKEAFKCYTHLNNINPATVTKVVVVDGKKQRETTVEEL